MKGIVNEKSFPVMIWIMILGVNTWTSSLEALLQLKYISFKWISSPSYRSFFYFEDISTIHSDFIIIKTGHFIGFAVLDLLIYNWKKSHRWSLGITLSFALLTEVLQLFFGRDGRLYDLLIDSFGAITVYFLLKFCMSPRQISNQARK